MSCSHSMISGSSLPKSAVPVPNIMPKPTSQKHGVPIQKSIRFFIRMLPVFFALVKPASHKRKACLHEKYQCRAEQHPNRVYRTEFHFYHSYFFVYIINAYALFVSGRILSARGLVAGTPHRSFPTVTGHNIVRITKKTCKIRLDFARLCAHKLFFYITVIINIFAREACGTKIKL